MGKNADGNIPGGDQQNPHYNNQQPQQPQQPQGNPLGGAQPAQPQQAAQPADDMAAFKAKAEKLTVMKEAGLITDEEFAAMKAELLKSIL